MLTFLIKEHQRNWKVMLLKEDDTNLMDQLLRLGFEQAARADHVMMIDQDQNVWLLKDRYGAKTPQRLEVDEQR